MPHKSVKNTKEQKPTKSVPEKEMSQDFGSNDLILNQMNDGGGGGGDDDSSIFDSLSPENINELQDGAEQANHGMDVVSYGGSAAGHLAGSSALSAIGHMGHVGAIAASVGSLGLKGVQKYKENDNKLDGKFAKEMAGDTAITGGKITGALLGAKYGAILGLAIGSVFPGLGHVIGGIVGGIAGSVVGGIAGEKAISAIVDKIKSHFKSEDELKEAILNGELDDDFAMEALSDELMELIDEVAELDIDDDDLYDDDSDSDDDDDGPYDDGPHDDEWLEKQGIYGDEAIDEELISALDADIDVLFDDDDEDYGEEIAQQEDEDLLNSMASELNDEPVEQPPQPKKKKKAAKKKTKKKNTKKKSGGMDQSQIDHANRMREFRGSGLIDNKNGSKASKKLSTTDPKNEHFKHPHER